MPTVLITGANRGVGLGLVRAYAEDGWHVIATCRNPEQADELATVQGTVDVHRLDICDHRRIAELAKSLKRLTIDVLINNAAVYGPRPALLGSIDFEAWDYVMRVNAMAPLKVSESFIDHISQSEQGKIINLSSKMGSMSDNESGGSYIYRSSKAALNAVMKSLAIDLAPRGIIVALVHPGWVKTDLGGPGALVSIEHSVENMRGLIDRLGPEDSGGFFNYDGAPIGW